MDRTEQANQQKPVMPTQEFWMVSRRDRSFILHGKEVVARPKKRHKSLDSALKEARRLAEGNPESPFIVLEAIIVVSSDGTKTVCSEPVAPEQGVRP